MQMHQKNNMIITEDSLDLNLHSSPHSENLSWFNKVLYELANFKLDEWVGDWGIWSCFLDFIAGGQLKDGR